MTPEKRLELASLLSKLVDHQAGDAELQKLDQLLAGDTEAQTYYAQYLSLHFDLEKRLQASPAAPLIPTVNSSIAWMTPVIYGTLLVLLAVGLTWHFVQQATDNTLAENTSPEPGIEVQSSGPVFAVLGSAAEAEWSLRLLEPKPGTQLGSQKVHLRKGRIRLDFPAGEQVTLEAPSIFEILNINKMQISEGKLVASVPTEATGFTVIMPNGAVVDLGTEFAIDVQPSGETRVKVLKGKVIASSTNSSGNTAWEKLLGYGDEATIKKDSPIKKLATNHPFIPPLSSSIEPLEISNEYTQAILDSTPLGYWKLDQVDTNGEIKNEVGSVPLQLGLKAKIKTVPSLLTSAGSSQGCLLVDPEFHPGFAQTKTSLPRLNTERGCTLEFWFYSDSMAWQALAALTLDGPTPKGFHPSIKHRAMLLLMERTGRSGSTHAHVHPDFAVRSMFRSPATYEGGVNCYSSNSYLIHKWHHVVTVKKSGLLQVFIDGELASESGSFTSPDEKNYFLIVGRMHDLNSDLDARQWSGAIDEVSIYDRAMTAEEVKRHFQAN